MAEIDVIKGELISEANITGADIEIIRESKNTILAKILLNGVDISNMVTQVELHWDAQKPPIVKLALVNASLRMHLNDSEVKLRAED